VSIKTLLGEVVSTTLEVSGNESVAELKKSISNVESNPFPEQVVSFQGAKLEDTQTLTDAGITDGATVHWEARPSHESFAKQLSSLLPASAESSRKSMSVEELGLMYSLKFGVTAGAVLGCLGKKTLLLSGFLSQHPSLFCVTADGKVRSAAAAAELSTAALVSIGKEAQPLTQIPEDAVVQKVKLNVSVTLELPYGQASGEAVELTLSTSDTVAVAKERLAEAALLPFVDRELSIGSVQLTDDTQRLGDVPGALAEAPAWKLLVRCSEASLVSQLSALLRKAPMSKSQLDSTFAFRYGSTATQAVKMLGWGEKFADFLARQPYFSLKNSTVSLSEAGQAEMLQASPRSSEEGSKLTKLLADIAPEDALEGLRQQLDSIAGKIVDCCSFVKVRRAVATGALVSGTAIRGDVGAEIVLFIEGLSLLERERWESSMAASIAGILEEQLAGQQGVASVKAGTGVVFLETSDGLGTVKLLLAPESLNYSGAYEGLARQKAESSQSGGAAAFAPQKVRFLKKQPEGVKASIRLLKHWRSQQAWSSESSRPSDDVIEHFATHLLTSEPPASLSEGVRRLLGGLEFFETLVVIWPISQRCYHDKDVPASVLAQRPLLMDATNPFLNLASTFEPAEMMALAACPFSWTK